MTNFEKNTNKIDRLLASGFYNSSVDAYLHIKNIDGLKQPMKDKLLTYLIDEQCDEELELFLGRNHSTSNLFWSYHGLGFGMRIHYYFYGLTCTH